MIFKTNKTHFIESNFNYFYADLCNIPLILNNHTPETFEKMFLIVFAFRNFFKDPRDLDNFNVENLLNTFNYQILRDYFKWCHDVFVDLLTIENKDTIASDLVSYYYKFIPDTIKDYLNKK